MNPQFKDIERAFGELKKRFQGGEISRQQFIEEMKKLRLKDEQGRFWMIGAQTGKWYYFDGKDWLPSEPPSQEDKRTICIYCGFENKLEADACARCGGDLAEEPKVCPRCGTKLEEPFLTCPSCSQQLEAAAPEKRVESMKPPVFPIEKEATWILRTVQPSSMLLFGGAFGIFLGIILGAFAGATAAFSQWLSFIPPTLLDLQGKLLGAVIYAVIGAIAGLVAGAVFGFVLAVFGNFIFSLVGGVRFTISRTAPKGKKEKPEDRHDYGFNFGGKR